MTVKPIRPDQIAETKKSIIPEKVIEAWNNVIASNYSNGRSKVLQKDAIRAIINNMYPDYDSDSYDVIKGKVFANRWLDIEEIYRAEGWKVEYDKPAYNESYDAYFIFTTK